MWDVIEGYCLQYPSESAKVKGQCAFLETLANPFPRDILPGHITASGIVIRENKMLLIHHRYIKEWFQPGGHVDLNELPIDAAIRELQEETGWITSPSPLYSSEFPLDIDIHRIPANPIKNEPEHLHVDFAYLLQADQQGHASDPETVAWFAIEECTAPRLARCIEKYQYLLSQQ